MCFTLSRKMRESDWSSDVCSSDLVLPLGVPGTEVLGQDLRAAAGDPVHARVAQPGRRLRVGDSGAVGEEDELRDRERVELDPVAVDRKSVV